VAVVGARQIIAAGLDEILRAEPDIDVVARLPSLAAARGVLSGLESHVVVVDVPVSAPSASVAILRLRTAAPSRAIVLLGRKDDANIVKAIEVGAAAYVDEDASRAHLLAAVRGAARGQRPIRDDMVGREDLIERLLEDVQDRIFGERAPSHPLTPRELHILELVGRGMRNRDIANELGLSEQTVKNHLTAVMHKIGVRNRKHAVAYARRQGWFGEPAETDVEAEPEAIGSGDVDRA
jgi:DNA-binding NarL/FixJ family response regulator